MRQALHIFLKDSRQFRWVIAALLVWTVVFAASADINATWMQSLPRPAGPWESLKFLGMLSSAWVLPAGWVFLIALVLHAEPLAGTRHFWLTRPYRRGSLVIAKALFIGVYVIATFVVAQAFVVGRAGLSLPLVMPALLWNQLLIVAIIVLPAVALATLTSGITHFVFALVVAPLVLFPMQLSGWSDVEWGRRAVVVAGIVAVATAIIVIQVRSRRAVLARAIGLAGVLTIVLASMFLPWPFAFDVHARAIGSRHAMRATMWSPFDKKPDAASLRGGVQLFYRVADVPDSAKVACDAWRVTIVGADGRAWRSRLQVSPVSTQYFDPPTVCPIHLEVPDDFLRAVADQTVHIQTTLYVTRLDRLPPVSIARAPDWTAIGPRASCSAVEVFDELPPSPRPTADEAAILPKRRTKVECRAAYAVPYALTSGASTQSARYERDFAYAGSAPLPMWPELIPVSGSARTLGGPPIDVTTTQWEATASQRVTIDTADVRLADYR